MILNCKMKVIFNICIVLYLLQCNYGFSQNIYSKQFTTQDGLGDNMVRSIHKDTRGIMWIGTKNGLSKMKGDRFITYNLNQTENLEIRGIKEDSRGILYLLTNDWISFINCRNESAGRVSFSPKDDSNWGIINFELQNDSLLWYSKDTTLILSLTNYDKNTERVYVKKIRSFSFRFETNERIMQFVILEDDKRVCLVTNHARVFILDISTGKYFEKTRLVTINGEFNATSILAYDNQIFITSLLYGIFVLDDTFRPVQQIVNVGDDVLKRKISHNSVYNLIPVGDSLLLAATWNGYTLLSPSKQNPVVWTTEFLTNILNPENTKIDLRMLSLYYDKEGYVWIGTHGGGVLILDWKWRFIKQFDFAEDNEINDIDFVGNQFYLSTYEKGVLCVNDFESTDKFISHKLFPAFLPNAAICSTKDKKGIMWFGYKDGTIVRYSTRNKDIQKMEISDSSVNAILINSHEELWIGTDDGLFLYNWVEKVKRKIKLIQYPERIYDLAKDEKGNLWIATCIDVIKITPNMEQSRLAFAHNPIRDVQCLLVAKDGTVYIGYQDGLGVIPSGMNVIENVLTTKDGLISNWINCLQEDDFGNIWIGTNSGFSCYNRVENKFYSHYVINSCKSVVKLGDYLLWGGNKHLLYFSISQALRSIKDCQNKKAVISGIEIRNTIISPRDIFNGQKILDESIEFAKSISLECQNKDFTLTYNIDPCAFYKDFVYRLLPYQDEWVRCSSDKVSYANLPPKVYTFQIKHDNGDMEGITSLEIKVDPHWTETILFRFIIILICFTIVFLYILYIRKKQQRQRLISELEHGISLYKLHQEKDMQLKEKRGVYVNKALSKLRPLYTLIVSPIDELLHVVIPTEDIYNKIVTLKSNIDLLYQQIDSVFHLFECEESDDMDAQFTKSNFSFKLDDDTSHVNNKILKGNKQYEFMKNVIDVIENNMNNEELNVKILADLLCVSQPTLYRKVKENFQLTVTELIRKIRLDKAAALLALHKYSILEISEMVGYNDYETFRKHFKKQFGISASKYLSQLSCNE